MAVTIQIRRGTAASWTSSNPILAEGELAVELDTGKFKIAKASIEQRCGRTGRTCAGTCFQLYKKTDFDKLHQFTEPKILLEDITSDFLNIIINIFKLLNNFKEN